MIAEFGSKPRICWYRGRIAMREAAAGNKKPEESLEILGGAAVGPAETFCFLRSYVGTN